MLDISDVEDDAPQIGLTAIYLAEFAGSVIALTCALGVERRTIMRMARETVAELRASGEARAAHDLRLMIESAILKGFE